MQREGKPLAARSMDICTTRAESILCVEQIEDEQGFAYAATGRHRR